MTNVAEVGDELQRLFGAGEHAPRRIARRRRRVDVSREPAARSSTPPIWSAETCNWASDADGNGGPARSSARPRADGTWTRPSSHVVR